MAVGTVLTGKITISGISLPIELMPRKIAVDSMRGYVGWMRATLCNGLMGSNVYKLHCHPDFFCSNDQPCITRRTAIGGS